MHETIDSLRRLLHEADEALTRQLQRRRLPKQREDDLAQATEAHRQAAALLAALEAQPETDRETRDALGAVQREIADLEVLLDEIRFDGAERQSLRARSAGAE